MRSKVCKVSPKKSQKVVSKVLSSKKNLDNTKKSNIRLEERFMSDNCSSKKIAKRGKSKYTKADIENLIFIEPELYPKEYIRPYTKVKSNYKKVRSKKFNSLVTGYINFLDVNNFTISTRYLWAQVEKEFPNITLERGQKLIGNLLVSLGYINISSRQKPNWILNI